jgi:hypothetical protein
MLSFNTYFGNEKSNVCRNSFFKENIHRNKWMDGEEYHIEQGKNEDCFVCCVEDVDTFSHMKSSRRTTLFELSKETTPNNGTGTGDVTGKETKKKNVFLKEDPYIVNDGFTLPHNAFIMTHMHEFTSLCMLDTNMDKYHMLHEVDCEENGVLPHIDGFHVIRYPNGEYSYHLTSCATPHASSLKKEYCGNDENMDGRDKRRFREISITPFNSPRNSYSSIAHTYEMC